MKGFREAGLKISQAFGFWKVPVQELYRAYNVRVTLQEQETGCTITSSGLGKLVEAAHLSFHARARAC